MSIGLQGNTDVVTLQRKLVDLGYLNMSKGVWGSFDLSTRNAVNKYKNDNGLWNYGQYEGVVGETTWKHMGLTLDNALEVGGNFGTPEANARVMYATMSGPKLLLPLTNIDSDVLLAGNATGGNNEVGLVLVSGEAGVIKENFNSRYAGAELDVMHAECKAGVTNQYVGAKAAAELTGAQGHVNIPLFWSGYDLVFTGELCLGGAGAEAGWSAEKGVGAKLAIGVGGGVFFKIQPSP